MAVTVPQSRLILKTIMSTMRNNLAFADIIDWEVHSDEMNDRNGFVVSEQVGPEYTITETDGAVANLTSGVQSTAFGSQTFTLNKVFGLSMGASDIESITDLQSARKAKALQNGVARLATKIDYHIANVAMKAFPWSVGTPDNSIDTPVEFATARTRLAQASLESDMDINAVLNHTDRQNLAQYIYNDNASLSSEGSRAMRRGFSGMLDGIPIKASNQLARLTTGTRDGVGAIAGANQEVNYTAAADSGSNQGYYLTQDLIVDSMGAGATVKAGEVFTIADVNSWDPEIGASRGFLQQFTVLADATGDTAGSITLRIFPAIVVQTGTVGVNNSHATVDAAPSNGAVVTFVGAASTTYTPRLMFKKESIVAHSAQLVLPYTGQGYRRALADAERDGVSPLMPRMWFYSDPDTGAHNCRVDVFVEAQARNRWQGIKFWGSA